MIRSWKQTWKLVCGAGLRGPLVVALGLGMIATWVGLIFPQWTGNPDLSHGIFTPLLFILLLKESRLRGPQRWLPPGKPLNFGIALILGASLTALILGALFASALDWTHPMVMFLLGSAFTGGIAAAWLLASSRELRIIPFNYIAAIAVGLWFFSLPVPPGTYGELTLTMQLWVSDRVLEALHFFGIPAVQNGNIIELAKTTVGVEEACSGVRSLLSCIYAGLFFSAAFVRHWISRSFLVVLAPLLAIAMNFVRSLTLTLLANAGVDIEGTWHDMTGFAILGVTALMLGALAFGLEKLEGSSRRTTESEAELTAPTQTTRWGSRMLAGGYGFAAACIGLCFVMTRPVPFNPQEAPRILSFLPATPEGWGIATSTGLYRFSDILETDHLGQRTYVKEGADGEILQVTFYLAYWPPGQTGVSVVASHTPDACWPGAGWAPLPTESTEVELELPERTLGRSEYRLFTNDKIPQHVWFWHSYDRELIREFDPRRPLELLNSVFTYGMRSNGEQLFVRMSSNRPWEEIQHEPLIAEIFRGLKPFGL
jgi:exosortase